MLYSWKRSLKAFPLTTTKQIKIRFKWRLWQILNQKFPLFKKEYKLTYTSICYNTQMQVEAEVKKFWRKTDTFELEMTLRKDKLEIRMKDLEQYVIYSKDCIQNEFPRRLLLSDIYRAISRGASKIKSYKYGAILVFQGAKCCRIQKGGKITIYVQFYESTMQFIFNLHKQREMTKNEIQGENNEQQTILGEKKLLAHIYEIIQKNRQQMTQQMTEQNKRMEEKFIQLAKEVKQNTQVIMAKINELQLKSEPQQDIQATIYNPNQANCGSFQMLGNKIIYTGLAGCITQFNFSQEIKWRQLAKFAIKISKMKRKKLVVGIIDYEQSKKQRNSIAKLTTIGLSASGEIYPTWSNSKHEFETADVIIVYVDRKMQTVRFLVNQKELSMESKILSEEKRIFVPFVAMSDPEDAIQWI